MNTSNLSATLYNNACALRMHLDHARAALANPAATARALAARLERGDADSAGSTLRTIGVVMVVAAVLSVVGIAVKAAGARAGTCIDSNGGC